MNLTIGEESLINLKTVGVSPGEHKTQDDACDASTCSVTDCRDCMFDKANIDCWKEWNNVDSAISFEDSLTSTGLKIIQVCSDLKEMLLAKNKAYGDSATDPLRMFGKSTPLEGLCTRIDDKLNRIYKGSEYPGDDTVNDLIGYLILYKIVKEQEDEK